MFYSIKCKEMNYTSGSSQIVCNCTRESTQKLQNNCVAIGGITIGVLKTKRVLHSYKTVGSNRWLFTAAFPWEDKKEWMQPINYSVSCKVEAGLLALNEVKIFKKEGGKTVSEHASACRPLVKACHQRPANVYKNTLAHFWIRMVSLIAREMEPGE